MMKIAFVYPEYENIGIEYLSAALKRVGHETELIYDPQLFDNSEFSFVTLGKFFNYRDLLVDKLVSDDYDLISFSVLSHSYIWACEIAQKVKKQIDAPIIFGGMLPTAVPEAVLCNDFVDMVCVGEGDEAIVDVAENIESGRIRYDIKNIWFKENSRIIRNPVRPLLKDLDMLPFPDKDIYTEVQLFTADRYTIMSSRGCPYKCTYCNNSLMKELYKEDGKYLRRRSVDNVLEELILATEDKRLKHIIFHDEVFTYDVGWLEEFSKRYTKEIGLPYFCWVHPNTINKKVVDLLERSNCKTLEMGVQTINTKTLERILHRTTTYDQIEKATRLLVDSNIFLITDNLIDLPGETSEDFINLIKFYNRNRVDVLLVCQLRYYPQTEIINKAIEAGILNELYLERLNDPKKNIPFTRRVEESDTELLKLNTVTMLMPLLSKKTVNLLLDRKVYKYIPACYSFIINWKIHSFVAQVFRSKKEISMSKHGSAYIRYYLHFMRKRLFSK